LMEDVARPRDSLLVCRECDFTTGTHRRPGAVLRDIEPSPADRSADRFPFLTEGKLLRISKVIGCDRVSLSFPVAAFNPEPTAWNSITTNRPGTVTVDPRGVVVDDQSDETRTASIEVEGQQVFCGLRYIKGAQRWYGKVEVNPARIGDPDGWESKGFAHAVDAMTAVVDQVATELMAPDIADAGQARVKRLDVCRDFQVPRPEFFIRGLGPVSRPWSKRNLVHFDPAKKGAQTLMVGSGQGVVRLYDKNAETGGKAGEGALRWEAQMRSGWCENYGGVERLSDLADDAKVVELTMNRWDWSAMGVEVSARQRVIEEVQRSDLSQREQVSFLGWLMLQAEGIASPMSSSTLAKYRRLTRELGVVLGPENVDQATQFTARLDFIEGREVLCA